VRELIEAELGMPVDKIRGSLNKGEFLERVEKGRAESQKFVDSHPDYIVCAENMDAIMQHVDENKLAWTKKNLDLVFDELKEKGILRLKTEAPVTTAVTATSQETIPPKVRPRATSTGLFSQHSSASGPAKPTLDQFAQEVAKMPAQEYRRKINSDPEFRKKVEQLGRAASR
jgi:hypothetical protein